MHSETIQNFNKHIRVRVDVNIRESPQVIWHEISTGLECIIRLFMFVN